MHAPPQQSAPEAHESPFCWQNDDAAQVPPLQKVEQHSVPCAQALPTVLHALLSGEQLPPAPQMPLQHCAPVAHADPSEVHAGNAHAPFEQVPLQQSLGCVQPPPGLRQVAPESALNAPPSDAPPLAAPVDPSGPPPLEAPEVPVSPPPELASSDPELASLPELAPLPPELAPLPPELAPVPDDPDAALPDDVPPPLLDAVETSTVPSVMCPPSPPATVALCVPQPAVAAAVARSAAPATVDT